MKGNSLLTYLFQKDDCCGSESAGTKQPVNHGVVNLSVIVPDLIGADCHPQANHTPKETSQSEVNRNGVNHQHYHSETCCKVCSCCGFESAQDAQTQEFIKVSGTQSENDLHTPVITGTIVFVEISEVAFSAEPSLVLASIPIHKRNQVFLN
jgi:hypothetical protein